MGIMLIPQDVLYSIFLYLKNYELLNVMLTCKYFYPLAFHATDPGLNQNRGLIAACKQGNIEYVKNAIKWNKFSVDPLYPLNAPLIRAIENGHTEIALTLLANTTFTTIGYSFNPLWIAAEKGNLEVTRFILRLGLGREILSGAISYASCNGHNDVLKELFEHPFLNEWIYQTHPMIQAVKGGHLDVVSTLIKNKIDPNAFDSECLRIACLKGNTKMVDLLLRCDGINPNNASEFLIVACVDNYTDIVKRLLHWKGILPSMRENAALNIVYMRGEIEMCRLLVNHPKIVLPISQYCYVIHQFDDRETRAYWKSVFDSQK